MIKKEQIEHLGELARLQISEKESEQLAVQVSAILDFVSKLSEVDTTAVEPTYYLGSGSSVTREDVAQLSDLADSLVKSFPESENGLMKSPNVFK